MKFCCPGSFPIMDLALTRGLLFDVVGVAWFLDVPEDILPQLVR